jgi:hypothetical protein
MLNLGRPEYVRLHEQRRLLASCRRTADPCNTVAQSPNRLEISDDGHLPSTCQGMRSITAPQTSRLPCFAINAMAESALVVGSPVLHYRADFGSESVECKGLA